MFAGAAGAVAAGGAAAYLKRDSLTEGWSWIGSHLEFVGCLMRGEELKSRLERVTRLQEEKGVGFADLVTVLGKAAAPVETTTTIAGGFVEVERPGQGGKERTFCTMPKSEKNRRQFERATNDKASDETEAHMSMFSPRANSGYYALGVRATELIEGWVRAGWYMVPPSPSAREDEGMDEGKDATADTGRRDSDHFHRDEEAINIHAPTQRAIVFDLKGNEAGWGQDEEAMVTDGNSTTR